MTTIKNTAPATVVVTSTVVGYTLACLANNMGIDPDIAGRVVQLDDVFHASYTGDAPYTVVTGLAQATDYNIKLGRFDSMNNTALVESGFNINFAPPISVRVKDYPSITSHEVTGEYVEVGSSPPLLNIELAGYADTIQVEYSEVGADTWSPGWSGPFNPTLALAGLPVGTWDIRLRGVIELPGFPYTEASGWVGLSAVELTSVFDNPSLVTDLAMSVARLMEPVERYDATLTWNWDRGDGPDIRYFVVNILDVPRYGDDWSKAEKVNTGTATNYTVIGHPYDRLFEYRVTSVSWGPEETFSNTSDSLMLTIDESHPTADLVRNTRLEMNYAHLKASILDAEGAAKQTFLLDAATGGLSIGKLDVNGNAPITIDGITGNLSVDGTIITNKIAAASFVLANTNGASNPALYSAAKPSYEDASEGIYMGHDGTNKFKFDLGNSTEYIRWDGSNLRISGDVLVGSGNTSIGTFGNAPTTVYYEVTNLASIPADTATMSLHYTTKLGKAPKLGSNLIYLKNDTVNGGFTRYYTFNGTTWESFNVVIEGGLLASGTVAANALQANTITGNEITSNLTLKVGSGNASTTISAAGSYRLWAGHDAAASAPFRVTSSGVLELNATKTKSALVIKNNVIKVFDNSGALRVKVGDLSA